MSKTEWKRRVARVGRPVCRKRKGSIETICNFWLENVPRNTEMSHLRLRMDREMMPSTWREGVFAIVEYVRVSAIAGLLAERKMLWDDICCSEANL